MVNGHVEVKKKPIVANRVERVTVYRTFSQVYLKIWGRFRIDWSCVERKEPIGAYEQLLESYRGGDFWQKDVAEGFTKDEAEMLKEYLWKTYSWELSYAKYRHRIFEDTLVMNKLGEFSLVASKKELRYVELYAQEAYNLPFKVIGYGHWI
jgi:hypothetical protein